MRPFNDEELFQADNKYRGTFKYRGVLSGETRSDCKLPFMLRIVADVYAGRELPHSLDDVKVLSEYLDKKLDKFNKEQGRNFLAEIGNALFFAEKNQKSEVPLLSGKVEESYLRSKLHLKASDKLPDELFTYNLLVRVKSEDGLHYIGFYYARIQDYVIAILSLKLTTKKETDFKALLPSLFESSIGQSVLSWYINVAKEDHKKILSEYLRTRALLFLKEYVRIIEAHFPSLKDMFSPYTSGKIGIVISNDQPDNKVAYGFRPLHKANDRALESIPVPIDHKLLLKLNVCEFKWKIEDFTSTNPLVAAKEEVKEQIKEIVTSGALNEDISVVLALEKSTAIIHRNVKALRLPEKQITYLRHWLPPDLSYLFPLNCSALLKKVSFVRAREYYWHKRMEEIITSKLMHGGQQVTGSISINNIQIDSKELDRKANKAVDDGFDIPEINVSRSPDIYTVLSNAIKIIQKEYASISSMPLPPPDVPEEEAMGLLAQTHKNREYDLASKIIRVQYSNDQLREYVTIFFETFFDEYRKIIEVNFPTIKNVIPLYSEFPTGAYVEIIDWALDCELRFGFKNTNETPRVEVAINPPEKYDPFVKNGPFRSWNIRSLNSIFIASDSFRFSGLDDSSTGMCPLRNFIYRNIIDDLDAILQAVNEIS